MMVSEQGLKQLQFPVQKLLQLQAVSISHTDYVPAIVIFEIYIQERDF